MGCKNSSLCGAAATMDTHDDDDHHLTSLCDPPAIFNRPSGPLISLQKIEIFSKSKFHPFIIANDLFQKNRRNRGDHGSLLKEEEEEGGGDPCSLQHLLLRRFQASPLTNRGTQKETQKETQKKETKKNKRNEIIVVYALSVRTAPTSRRRNHVNESEVPSPSPSPSSPTGSKRKKYFQNIGCDAEYHVRIPDYSRYYFVPPSLTY